MLNDQGYEDDSDRFEYEVTRQWFYQQDNDEQWIQLQEDRLNECVERASKTIPGERDSLESGRDERQEERREGNQGDSPCLHKREGRDGEA